MVFRVATLNLKRNESRWRERRHLVVDEIARLQPDILTLNEVSPHTGRWLQRQAQSKANLRYALTQHSKNDTQPMTEAEAILTTHRVVGRAHRFFSTPDTVFVAACVEVDGQRLDVYVTHLYSYRYDDSLRAEQVRELLAWIDARDTGLPAIVCGDFNAGLDHASIQTMTQKFRPTQQSSTAFTPLREPPGEPTHIAWERFDRCIDFIWVSQGIRVQSGGLCFDRPPANDPTLWPSDHVGVWANLVAAPAPRA